MMDEEFEKHLKEYVKERFDSNLFLCKLEPDEYFISELNIYIIELINEFIPGYALRKQLRERKSEACVEEQRKKDSRKYMEEDY